MIMNESELYNNINPASRPCGCAFDIGRHEVVCLVELLDFQGSTFERFQGHDLRVALVARSDFLMVLAEEGF